MNFYLDYSLRGNTRKLYSTHQATYLAICHQLRINPNLPLSEFDLCAAVGTFATSHKRTTVPGFVSAIAHRAHTLGHGDLPRTEGFRRVMQGINNFHGDQAVRPKKAITVADLIAIYQLIDHTTFQGARNWCACTLAFFGLLRINEYANGGLQHRHISVTAAGVAVIVPYSKTSLVPARIDMASRSDILSPARERSPPTCRSSSATQHCHSYPPARCSSAGAPLLPTKIWRTPSS